MSWYSTDYRKRAAISVDCTAAGGTVDVTVSVPSTWDDFWTSILSNGYDVVVTRADGVTLCTFERASYTYATRALTLEIDDVTLVNGKMNLLWVYYNNPSEVTDRSTAVAPSSPKTGYIELFRPSTMFRYQPDRWGSERPKDLIVKKSGESVDIFIAGFPLKGRAPDTLYGGAFAGEEISHVAVAASSGGASAPTLYDATYTRIMQEDGAQLISVRLTAGSDATDYTIKVTVTTTTGQVFEWRGWLKVRDTDEA